MGKKTISTTTVVFNAPKKPKKTNYNKLAKSPRLWRKEATIVMQRISNSPYAAPKVEPKLYSYEEVREWF